MPSLKSLTGGALALLAAGAGADAPQVREATTVQAFPDVELSGGRYTTCGVRVLFSDSTASDDFEMYDLTVALYGAEAQAEPLTVVRATLRRGNLARDPNLQGSLRTAPLDVLFGVKVLPDPVALRDRSTQERTLIAVVDEAKARRSGDIGGPLLRQLTQGEPVIVFWIAAAKEQRIFRVRIAPDQDLIDTVQSCTKALSPPRGVPPDHG